MRFAVVATRDNASALSPSEFEGLMRKTHRQAYGLAFRLTGNSAEAEDLTQETFLRAFRFVHRYDQSLPFTSWLFRIMTNTYIDTIRRKGRVRVVSLEQAGADGLTPWDVPDSESVADKDMMERTLEEPVQRALQAMTPEFRTAVVLADIEGMAYDEIADVMRTSVGTVRSRIHRGRRQLRSYLKTQEADLVRRYCNEL